MTICNVQNDSWLRDIRERTKKIRPSLSQPTCPHVCAILNPLLRCRDTMSYSIRYFFTLHAKLLSSPIFFFLFFLSFLFLLFFLGLCPGCLIRWYNIQQTVSRMGPLLSFPISLAVVHLALTLHTGSNYDYDFFFCRS